MKIFTKTSFWILLPLTVLLISNHGMVHAQTGDDTNTAGKGELPAAAPELADIIPLAEQLNVRLLALENNITGGLDVAEVEKNLNDVQVQLEKLAERLQRLKESNVYKYYKLSEVKEAIAHEDDLLKGISLRVGQAIRQLENGRKGWLAEKRRWQAWQSALLEDEALDQLKPTFTQAHETIGTALRIVLPQLEALLTIQEKTTAIHTRINALASQCETLIANEQHDAKTNASPPMFSSRYFSQFGIGMWYESRKKMDEMSWRYSRFLTRQGWVILIEGFLCLLAWITIHRNKRVLSESTRWRFLAARPVSASLLVVCLASLYVFEYMGAPPLWKLGNMFFAGTAFARLAAILVNASWKSRFVYGLVALLIVTRFMEMVGLPLPLFRLYVVTAALVGLLCCLRWAGESSRQKEPPFFKWVLLLLSLFLAVIMVAELWGKDPLPLYLLVSLTDTIATVLVFSLLMYVIRGGLEGIFRTSLFQQTPELNKNTDTLIRRLARFFDVVICGLVVLPATLVIWGVYDNLPAATKGVLAMGVTLGAQRITIELLIVAAGILYGSFFVSWILQKVFLDVVLVKRQAGDGVGHSVGLLIHYTVTLVGFLIAITALGFDVTKFTIMLSALGVGVGFGLQSIVNNFISGLMLLVERPIRVGDCIEFEGNWNVVKRIGLRATTFQNFDSADVIIPNADLINNRVVNWTLSNRRLRLTIPVGVAYGSDVPLVIETLTACANASTKVATMPAPQVLFLHFGESSLDFEIRVFVLDVDDRLKVSSTIHQEIERSFREKNIEIAFPQRDLHVRSLDKPVNLQPSEKTP